RRIEIIGSVKLIPDGTAASLDYILDGNGGLRRKNLKVAFRLRCARGSDFAVPMECALAADGTQNDRRIELHAEQLHRHVHFADVDEASRLELIVRVTVAIGSECFLAVNSRHQITPVGRRYCFLCRCLQIEDVERVGCLIQGLRESRNRSEERACCEKFEKRST